MIKGIALDLDGTLLNSEKKISNYNKKIIKQVVASGVTVVIATGRVYEALLSFQEELELKTPIVCYNGAVIIDENGRKIFSKNLERDDTKKLINIARENNIHLNLFKDDKWYVEKEREEVVSYKKLSGLDYIVKDFDEFEELNPIKLMYISDHKKLLNIEKEVDEKLNDSVYRAFSKPYFLEVLHKEVSKGKSIMGLFEKMGFHKDEIMAFGDGFNDYEMLTLVGHGVVMANAPIELKEKIGREALSNDEDGVGRYLANFFNLDKGE